MGILDVLRRDPVVRLMRREPVLVVPATVGPGQVERHVREWCPDAVRRTDTVLATRDGFTLHGPVLRTGPAWPDPGLPARLQAAYVTEWRREGVDYPGDHTRYQLLDGLARRLSGLVRETPRKPWQAPGDEPSSPTVLAPRRLTPDEAIRVLSAQYPGLTVGYQDEDTYELYDDGQVLSVELTTPSIFPLVRLQPWYTRAAEVTEYTLTHLTTEEELRRMVDVAGTLARATGGIVLDQDGFPWR
jgi:hypothetical protein